MAIFTQPSVERCNPMKKLLWNHPEIQENEEFKWLLTNYWHFPGVWDKIRLWKEAVLARHWYTSRPGSSFPSSVLGLHCKINGTWLRRSQPGPHPTWCSAQALLWQKGCPDEWAVERRQWWEPGRPGTDSSSVVVLLSCDFLVWVSFLLKKFGIISIIQGGCKDQKKSSWTTCHRVGDRENVP